MPRLVALVEDQTPRELKREQHRCGWIESHNTELAAERDRLLEEIRNGPRAIETPTPAVTIEALPAQHPAMSRAERRRLERAQQQPRR